MIPQVGISAISHVFFVVQVESLKVEAARECKAAQDSITTTYKLELMKMPKQVCSTPWTCLISLSCWSRK